MKNSFICFLANSAKKLFANAKKFTGSFKEVSLLKFLKSYKKAFAFSLIELLISLITISCIVAAFAPVITKKLNKIDTTLALSLNDISTNCKDSEDVTSF